LYQSYTWHNNSNNNYYYNNNNMLYCAKTVHKYQRFGIKYSNK